MSIASLFFMLGVGTGALLGLLTYCRFGTPPNSDESEL